VRVAEGLQWLELEIEPNRRAFMHRILASGVFVALSAAFLAAQSTPMATVQPPATSRPPQMMTLSGCVNPGATPADPLLLSNATRLAPTTYPEAGVNTSSAAGTAGTAGTTGTVATGVPPVSGTTGTAGTAGTTTGVMPTTGVTGTAAVGSPAGVPTTGVSGTAGATTPGAAAAAGLPPSTYQLSGMPMSAYSGQSVQVTGMLVPSPNVAATAGASASGVTRPTGSTDVTAAPTSPAAVPQFQVTRVEPLGIRCPQD
jgi:hypothetical protein